MYRFGRYHVDFDAVANKATAFIYRSRHFVMLIQSLLYPIKAINDRFKDFALEKTIEANMTSQTMYFEWFINRKLAKYLGDKRISFDNIIPLGTPVYFIKENKEHLFGVNSDDELDKDIAVHNEYEKEGDLSYSFVVSVPEVDTIDQTELNNMVRYWVDKYKVVGKTYTIKNIK